MQVTDSKPAPSCAGAFSAGAAGGTCIAVTNGRPRSGAATASDQVANEHHRREARC
jgi:hypothetical protein